MGVEYQLVAVFEKSALMQDVDGAQDGLKWNRTLLLVNLLDDLAHAKLAAAK